MSYPALPDEDAGERLKDLVPRRMAVQVVDGFEISEINLKQSPGT